MTGWLGLVACIEEMNDTYKVWPENLRERDHLETVVDGRMLLKWILLIEDAKMYIGFKCCCK
jgi:hypothetical protein